MNTMKCINGNYIATYRPRDWNGKPVTKTQSNSPYSYDAYVISQKKHEYEHSVYSDRLYQWDWDKHNNLCRKYFGNEGQYWDNRSDKDIESFLRDYMDNQELVLVGVMKGCNVSSGYPYWIFMYDDKQYTKRSEDNSVCLDDVADFQP